MEVQLALKAGELQPTKVLWKNVLAEKIFVVDQKAFSVGLPGDDANEGSVLDFLCGCSLAIFDLFKHLVEIGWEVVGIHRLTRSLDNDGTPRRCRGAGIGRRTRSLVNLNRQLRRMNHRALVLAFCWFDIFFALLLGFKVLLHNICEKYVGGDEREEIH